MKCRHGDNADLRPVRNRSVADHPFSGGFSTTFYFFLSTTIVRDSRVSTEAFNIQLGSEKRQYVDLSTSAPLHRPQKSSLPSRPLDIDRPYGAHFSNPFLVAYQSRTRAARDFLPPSSRGCHQWLADGDFLHRNDLGLQTRFDYRKRCWQWIQQWRRDYP